MAGGGDSGWNAVVGRLRAGGLTVRRGGETVGEAGSGGPDCTLNFLHPGDADILSETSLWWNNGAGSFTQQTVTDNIEVKFTHTSDNSLTSFVVCISLKCRIFFSKF